MGHLFPDEKEQLSDALKKKNWTNELEVALGRMEEIRVGLKLVEDPLNMPTKLDHITEGCTATQHTLNELKSRLEEQEHWKTCSPKDKARMTSLRGRGTSGYLKVMPSDGNLLMPDAHFKVALQRRLVMRCSERSQVLQLQGAAAVHRLSPHNMQDGWWSERDA